MTIGCLLAGRNSAVITIDAAAPVTEAVQLLHDHRIGAVLAIADGCVAGVVSERDIVRALHSRGGGALDASVGDVMTSPVVTVTSHDTVDEALSLMTERRFRHLPVVEGGRLLGIVSIGDLVKRKIDDAIREAEMLKDYIHAA